MKSAKKIDVGDNKYMHLNKETIMTYTRMYVHALIKYTIPTNTLEYIALLLTNLLGMPHCSLSLSLSLSFYKLWPKYEDQS